MHERASELPEDLERADLDDALLQGRALLDVRAPCEVAKGRAPGAHAIALLEDDERARVGACYAESGNNAAVALGHRLVSGATRDTRLSAWVAWAERHENGALYCARGGQRSEIVQAWLAAEGHPRARISGGYKALRRHLSERLAQLGARAPLLVVSGRTGTGKTALLCEIERHVDLEALAQHRGSSFGGRHRGQPCLADFENKLALELLRLQHESSRPIAIEDESRNIGRIKLPAELYARLVSAPIAVVDEPMETRVTTTLRAYVLDACDEQRAALGEDAGFDAFAQRLRDALGRIQRRLGGDRHARIAAALEDALRAHRTRGDVEAHRAWIEALLTQYYDPTYDHGLEARGAQIAFRGDARAVAAWLRERCRDD